MQALELKVPPPIVALLIAAAMWGLSLAGMPAVASFAARLTAALAVALPGVATGLAGAHAFKRAKTTISPMKPEKASSLVTSGVYRFTRNPMYLGLLCVLVAWATFMGSARALAGPAAFVLYIGRFQIVPEERRLAARFGSDYSSYMARVRRWL